MTPTCWTPTFPSAITLVHTGLTQQKPKSHWLSKQEARAWGLLSTRLANLTKCVLYFLAPKICVKVNICLLTARALVPWLLLVSSGSLHKPAGVLAFTFYGSWFISTVSGDMWLRVSSAHWLWNSWESAPPTWLTKRMLKLRSFLVTEFNRRASISLSTCWKSLRRHNITLTYNPHDGLVGILSVYKGKNKGSENFIPCPVSLTD